MIELQNINKSFKTKIIFKDLNFKINKNEMIAIMGDSGSGKSTLLNIIGLIERPDAGTVILNNQVFSKINNKKIILAYRNLIGYIFQNFALIDNKTVSENIDVALMYSGYNKKEKQNKKIEVLKFLGLEDKLNNKIYELSGGEQQRIALARVLLKRCEIILADEPTGSLDPTTSNDILNILTKLNQDENKTIIIVTHDLNIAKRCNKIYKIQNYNLINL